MRILYIESDKNLAERQMDGVAHQAEQADPFKLTYAQTYDDARLLLAPESNGGGFDAVVMNYQAYGERGTDDVTDFYKLAAVDLKIPTVLFSGASFHDMQNVFRRAGIDLQSPDIFGRNNSLLDVLKIVRLHYTPQNGNAVIGQGQNGQAPNPA